MTAIRLPAIIAAVGLATLLGTPGPALAESSARELMARQDALRATAAILGRDLQAAKDAGIDAPLDQAAVDLELGRLYLGHADLLRSLHTDLERAEHWTDLAAFSLRQGALDLAPSRAVEARGLLLDADSIPKSLPEVRTLIQQLSAANFNILLPEVVRRGYAIYPSRLLERDPEFAKAPDVFGEFVREAHRAGMEVHPWIWTFRVRSYDQKVDYGNPVLSRLPALAARTEGTDRPRFLSPASPGAREWVQQGVAELLTRYDVDGLFLDYIRYDEETPNDWVSQTAFRMEQLGLQPAEVIKATPRYSKPVSGADAEKRDYQLWREEQVNRVVADISAQLKRRPRKPALSAATFRGESYSRQYKLQNWRHWADNEWLTFVTSMLYSPDTREVEGWINQETEGGKRPSLFYPILGIHRMDDPLRDTLDQIQAVREQGQGGVFLFALGHLPKGFLSDLARGPFRTPASIPHRDPLISARHVLQGLGHQYLAQHATSDDWATVAVSRVLAAEVGGVVRLLAPGGNGRQRTAAAFLRLQELIEVADRLERPAPGFSFEVRTRLRYASNLLKAHVHRVETTRYVPPIAPPVEGTRETSRAPRLDP